MPDDIAKIAGALTKAQRTASFYGIGYKRVPVAVIALAESGLVTVHPAVCGWAWKPTPTGLAVREYLETNNG